MTLIRRNIIHQETLRHLLIGPALKLQVHQQWLPLQQTPAEHISIERPRPGQWGISPEDKLPRSLLQETGLWQDKGDQVLRGQRKELLHAPIPTGCHRLALSLLFCKVMSLVSIADLHT